MSYSQETERLISNIDKSVIQHYYIQFVGTRIAGKNNTFMCEMIKMLKLC